MQDRMLPDEVLQVIFTIAIEDDPSISILLPLVSKYFLMVSTKTAKDVMLKYLGPFHDLSQYSLIHPYPTLFYQTIQDESKRLKRVSEMAGLSLTGVHIVCEAVILPSAFECFVISAVSSRAYEELHALIEKIKLKYVGNISLKRVVDAIYQQAALNYNVMEFLRLKSFIPIEINSMVGYVCAENHRREYSYLSLIEHAIRFGNKKLVIGLVELGVNLDIYLLEKLKNNLASFPENYKWREIYAYLLECISPQVAPLDCPGPL